VHWVFSKEETLGLVTACRKRRVSLSGALFAAICCGLMDCLPDAEARFKCKFPIDLRAQLGSGQTNISALDLGCFVSFFQEYYVVHSRPDFWALARQLHEDLQKFVNQQGPAFIYNLSKRVTDLRPPTHIKRGTLLATNYGVVNLRARYGRLRPTSCTLIFKNDIVGPSLVMEALTLGLELNVGLAAFDLEPAFWDRLHEKVRGYLQRHAEATPERLA
jgi:hypothetical protein